MTSVDDMQATEAALADKQFRKIWWVTAKCIIVYVLIWRSL
jgi:hypothetical protein